MADLNEELLRKQIQDFGINRFRLATFEGCKFLVSPEAVIQLTGSNKLNHKWTSKIFRAAGYSIYYEYNPNNIKSKNLMYSYVYGIEEIVKIIKEENLKRFGVPLVCFDVVGAWL